MAIDDLAGKRKVVTRGGIVGVVTKDHGKYSLVQIERNGYYKLVDNVDLEDITEEDFKKGFRGL